VSTRPHLHAAGTADGNGEALGAIADRLTRSREQLAHRLDELLHDDGADAERLSRAREDIDDLVALLRSGGPITVDHVRRLQERSARRVHQRVPLEFVLHSVRSAGEVVWDAVVDSAHLDQPHERETTIEIATLLMRQVDAVSRIVARAYLDEVTDRGLLRRDLLDALLAGRGGEDNARCLARCLRVTLAEYYAVVVARGEQMHGELGRDEPLASRAALDRIVEATRQHVRPEAGSLLTGMHQGDLIVLYPLTEPGRLEPVREACRELAAALTVDVSLGMSVGHRGLPAIATAYAEARDAVAIAHRAGVRGRAVELDEVVIDHMLAASPPARRILERTLGSLADYDRAHATGLVTTLDAYVKARFNLTRSAEALSVHPNTVVYRLRRIREISGRDPRDLDDLMVLSLAVKALELRPDAQS
jgi:sugar diacid utilization regulator